LGAFKPAATVLWATATSTSPHDGARAAYDHFPDNDAPAENSNRWSAAHERPTGQARIFASCGHKAGFVGGGAIIHFLLYPQGVKVYASWIRRK